jgi:hypothetical protein
MTFSETMDSLDKVRTAVHHALMRQYDPQYPLAQNESLRELADGKQYVYASYTRSSEFFVEAVAYQQAARAPGVQRIGDAPDQRQAHPSARGRTLH